VQGHEDAATATITDVAPGRYYLSVLPYSGHAMAGIPVDLRSGEATVTVTTEAHPIPAAQIAVYLFEDCYPLNGAPDLPEEEVACVNGDGTTNNSCTEADGHPGPDFTKFRVVIEEPAGKYGANGGPLLQDAFGNLLGTSYTGDAIGDCLGDPSGAAAMGTTCGARTPAARPA
jgi:hypothetical protein